MTEFRVLTYNVRYADADDPHDPWVDRRAGVVALLSAHAPDVFGLQETLARQREYLESELPAYRFIGQPRTAADEHVPLGVRRDRFDVLDHGTFWLSPSPTTESVGWDGKYPRVATWARLRESTPSEPDIASADPTEVLVCTTHFDHEGETARRESARLLGERLPELADGLPIVLVGDLNCVTGSDPHRILADHFIDAASTAAVSHGPDTSLTDFDSLIHDRRIDHVFVSPNLDVQSFATLTDRDDRNRYPSDHLPVAVRVQI